MSTMIHILEQIGALLSDDHFVYSSGKHGDVYINKNDLFANTRACEHTGRLLSKTFSSKQIDTVAGPAICGIIPAHWAAYHLSLLQEREVFGVFAERDINKNFTFERGYDKFISKMNVLVVDDITTSGATMAKFIKLVQSIGGHVVAAAVLVNRNPRSVNSETLGVPFEALSSVEIPAYEEADCPLCKKGIPINTTVGHGKQYVLAKQPAK